MTIDPGPALVVRGLTKQYGALAAVRDLSFEVRRGAVFGFLGPNGAGKTTTIRMLLGLVKPSAGSAEVLGHDLARDRAAIAGKVGAIVETPTFYPHLSGSENLAALAWSAGRALDVKRRGALLARVGLEGRAHEKVKGYSLGMKQRLGLAAALINDPELILLDEPTNGLDPEGAVEMRALLSSIAAEGKTLLVSSHLLSEVEKVCTEVVILKKGVALLQGKVADLLGRRGTSYELKVSSSARGVALLGEAATARGESALELRCEEPAIPGHLRALLAGGIEVFAVTRRRDSLEELFLEVTAEGGAS